MNNITYPTMGTAIAKEYRAEQIQAAEQHRTAREFRNQAENTAGRPRRRFTAMWARATHLAPH